MAELCAQKDENSVLMNENMVLINANALLKSEKELLHSKIETLNTEIKVLADSRNLLKNENEDANKKVLSFCQELFDSKQVAVDLAYQFRDVV